MKAVFLIPAALAVVAAPVFADAAHYSLDVSHTYVSFEAPHIAGISIWRGKFARTKPGTIVLDRAAKTGSMDIVIDMTSIDTGLAKLDEHLQSPDFFDAAKYPTAEYKASKIKFSGETPTEIEGDLTMHGVTKPVALKVNSFKCITHPMLKVPYCGADASATINRSEFGVGYGVDMVGSPEVKLEIQVEAKQDDAVPAAK